MASLYYLYQTNSGNTVIDRSETSFIPLPANTGELQYDILIPETQPLFYYKEDSSTIVPNDDATIEAYEAATNPPTEDDKVSYNQFTGYTSANNTRVTNVETALISVDQDVTYVSGVTSGNTANIALNQQDIESNKQDVNYLSGVTSGQTQDITYLSGATEGRVRWLNRWDSGTTYQANDMVLDGDWTMIANTTTTDLAAPQQVGDERYLYFPLIPSGTSTTAKQIVFGMQYSGDTPYWLNGYRIYVTAGNYYEIILVKDPEGVGETSFINSFTAEISGWREFSLNPRPVNSGTSYQLLAIMHQPDPSPVTLTYPWEYLKPNNVTLPLTGEITHANKDLSSLLINYLDDNGQDRSGVLLGLDIGDFIVIGTTRWAIQLIQDEGSYVDFTVAPARQAIVSGLVDVDFETTLATSLSYGQDTDYWSGTTNVQGLLAIDDNYQNVTASTNQYGVDILVQNAYISPDWDFVTSQGASAGSSGGAIGEATWGFIQGDISNQDDLQNQFDTKVNLSGDTMTGDLSTTSLYLTNPNTGGTLNDWYVRYDPITKELRTIDTGSGSTQTTYCYTDRRDIATNATDVNASYLSESWELSSGYYEYEYNAHFGQGNFNRCATVCFMMDGAVVGSCNLMKTNDGSVITTAYVTQNNQLTGGTYQPEILFREIGGGTASVYYGSIRVQKIGETA